MSFKNSYVIRRIRLINFHNIQNETIQVENGGHLFFLGDNGSGKTTVLDAIHYVLTAGELVELNSAARVAGQRAEGRRIQGIIMRFNTETGPLNKDGGITYAALELKNDKNQVLTLGMGMTVAAMDEPVQRWGIVAPQPLEEIPFLMDEMQGTRPRTRLEMKAAMDPIGGFYNVGPFRREIIYRLYNNEDIFTDVCRLLRIGKAYREIVAQSNDYHELFMRLMPEPKTEIFENVILSLQSLEDSKTVLEDFERKRAYISELAGLTAKISSLREDAGCLDWLACYRRLERLARQIAAEEDARDRKRGDLKALDEEQRNVEAERELLEKQLADLKTKDHSGLVRQEKELAKEQKQTAQRRKEEESALKKQRKELAAHLKQKQRNADDLKDFLKQSGLKLGKLSTDLPFSIANLATAVDYLYRQDDAENRTPMLPVAGPVGRAREEVIGLEKELALLEKERNDLNAIIETEEKRIEQLDAAHAMGPEVADFRETRTLLNLHMIETRPLFEGLEWRSGVTQRLKSAVEELIGPDILGTFLVAEDRADEAKRVVFKQYPGMRITHPSLGTDHYPDWFRTTFDLKNSHPDALRCLAAEMAADQEPNIAVFSDRQLLAYRGHERRLRGKPARLIGADGRKKAMEREIKELKKALKEQVARRTELEKRCEDLTKRTEHLRELITFLDKANTTYRTMVGRIANLNLTAEHMEGALGGAVERFERLSADLAGLEQRLETMRTIISKEGLANLETRIARAQNKHTKTTDRLQEIMEARGAMKRDVHLIDNSIQALETERREQRKLQRTLTARLREQRENLGDPERYVLDEWKGRRFKTIEDITIARQRRSDREIETRTLLRARMAEPSLGAGFAFVYEEEKNQLLDRRSRTIDELQDYQHKTIEDQRQVINDKTFHLFKEIIMRELVNELRKMVFELEEMKNSINKLLERRTFGKCRYRFSLKPKKQYKHLIDIIAGMDLVRSEPEKELRTFFDDHKQEIINTEAGEIPDLLDYRNWYQFEMQVTITDQDGSEKERIAMTRKVKSIGSGGEQAVPNYLLVLTIAHFLYGGSKVRLKILLFDEAFYGIDAGRRDQLLGFAGDLGLQLFVASPDQDGVKREIDHSTTVLIVKDANYDVHTYKFDWANPNVPKQHDLFEEDREEERAIEFGEELAP